MKKINICSGIIIDDLGRLFLIKRKYDKKDLPNYWGLVGGWQDEGESFEEAAIREVKEESNLDFKIKELFYETEIINEDKKRINHFYRYLGVASGKIIIQEEECDGYGWFNYEECKNLLTNQDMKNIIEKLYIEKLIK